MKKKRLAHVRVAHERYTDPTRLLASKIAARVLMSFDMRDRGGAVYSASRMIMHGVISSVVVAIRAGISDEDGLCQRGADGDLLVIFFDHHSPSRKPLDALDPLAFKNAETYKPLPAPPLRDIDNEERAALGDMIKRDAVTFHPLKARTAR